MSARSHSISFREFSGGYTRSANQAATSKPSAVGRFLRRVYDAITQPPPVSEIGRAYGHAFGTRPIPMHPRGSR